MIKLLIADDEPLVLVGMQSILDWNALGIELCATAHNGRQALQLIERHRPELVITDIKMPLMSGLELATACREKGDELPLFIMLTSYEEFSFVKEAMHLSAVDYLIKLELTAQNLQSAVEKALARIAQIKGDSGEAAGGASEGGSLLAFEEKFFVRLYSNLFESPAQFSRQAEALGLDFSADVYAVAACEIANVREMPTAQQLTLCTSAVKMVRDTLEKFGPCTVTALDMRHFNVLFPLTQTQAKDGAYLPRLMRTAVDTVQRYFSAQLLCGIGSPVQDAFTLSDSFHSARCLLALADTAQPVADTTQSAGVPEDLFDFSQFRSELAKAFEELDTAALHSSITHIVQLLAGHPSRHVQAKDAAFGLLYMTLTLLPDGEATLSHIFADTPDSYRCIYKFSGTAQCCAWMERLRDGLCENLRSEHNNYKRRVVTEVTEYIRQNLNRRLTLNEVAAAFSFSPNYLSQLFAKYAPCGFVETITREKIAAAKAMMIDSDRKIYEIAERLGYESAFYFSKVFKKETGLSPREYMQQQARPQLQNSVPKPDLP